MTETRLEKANYTLRQLNNIKDKIAVLNDLTHSGRYDFKIERGSDSLIPSLSEERRQVIIKIVRESLEEQLAKTTALFQQL